MPAPKRKYRVLTGRHVEKHILGTRPDKSIVERDVMYGVGCDAGAVFESENNMLKHNAPGMSPKFALLEEPSGPETEEALEQRIAADQTKLSAIRGVKTQTPPADEPFSPNEGEEVPHHPATFQEPVARAEVHTPHPKVQPQQPKPQPPQAKERTLKAKEDSEKKLKTMTLKQLQDLAEEEEIDCSSCKTKDDYVEVLKEHDLGDIK